MKERLSVSEEKLLGLEKGSMAKDALKEEQRDKRHECYERVIRLMKLVLYVELVVFVAWAGYTTWQGYRVGRADPKSANVTRDPWRSSPGHDAAPEPRHLDASQTTTTLEGLEKLGQEEELVRIKIKLNPNERIWKDANIPAMPIPQVRPTFDTEYKSPLQTDKTEKWISRIDDVKIATENSENSRPSGFVSEKSDFAADDSSTESTFSEEPQEVASKSEDPERIIFPASEEEEHVDFMTPLSFFWSSESSSSSEQREKINLNDEGSVESELADKTPSSERTDQSTNENPAEASDGLIEGTLLRYRSGKLESCEYEHILNRMYSLKCKPFEDAVTKLIRIFPSADSIAQIEPFFVWDPEVEVVDMCFLYKYFPRFNIASCEPRKLRTIEFVNAIKDMTVTIKTDQRDWQKYPNENYSWDWNRLSKETSVASTEQDDQPLHPYAWQIFRINMVTMQEELCFTESLLSLDLMYNLQCLPVDYLRNTRFTSIPMIHMHFLLFDGVQDRTMACPLSWIVNGCRSVETLLPSDYLSDDSFEESASEEVDLQGSPSAEDPVTWRTSNAEKSLEETTVESHEKTTERTNVPEVTSTPSSTESNTEIGTESSTEIATEISTESSTKSSTAFKDYRKIHEDLLLYDEYFMGYPDIYYHDDASFFMRRPSRRPHPFFVKQYRLYEPPLVRDVETVDTSDSSTPKNDAIPSGEDDTPLDESSYVEDDVDWLGSSDFDDPPLDHFRKRRSVDESEKEAKNTETKSGAEIPPASLEKGAQDAAFESDQKADEAERKKRNDLLKAMNDQLSQIALRDSVKGRHEDCIFDWSKHPLFRRSTAAGGKIDNEIADERTSKENFYERVRAKMASRASRIIQYPQSLPTDDQFQKLYDKMSRLAAHIDRLHKRFLEKKKLTDDYVSNEFPYEENL